MSPPATGQAPRRRRADRYAGAQRAVERVLLSAPPLDPALPRLLAAVAEPMGWNAGVFWGHDEDRDCLAPRAVWSADGDLAARLRAAVEGMAPARGEGLAGRALASGRVEWGDDAGPSRAGLDGAVALPATSGAGQVVGVMELLAFQLEPADRDVDALITICAHVGQFLRRRQAEQALAATAAELRRRAAELERSNAELEQFAYVASHDLSEPLRMVAGFVRLLSERYSARLDADAGEFIAYALDGVDRMQALIDDLLAYSRVGQPGRRDGAVDLAEVLEDVRLALRGGIEEAGARVEADGLPVVRGNPRELRQLLQNLVSNAIKFAREGEPPVVRVSAWREGAGWCVSVAYTGIGIDPAHAERVFKMFQRLHGRDRYEGTGIGLAICQKIVDAHGGRIWVQPADGGGSDFRFALPAGEGAA